MTKVLSQLSFFTVPTRPVLCCDGFIENTYNRDNFYLAFFTNKINFINVHKIS